MVTLSIKVPAAQKARLHRLAVERRSTISDLMRRALDSLAAESSRTVTTSCYELVRDLFDHEESLDASPEGDRSANRKHLRNFGKRGRAVGR
jgi:predicted transcriptional regulator